MRHLRFALTSGFILLFCIALFATEPNNATRRWWSHIKALADDRMEGRDTGSEGHARAARYVAGEFKRAGLKPAGDGGYLQSVPLRVVRLRPDAPNRFYFFQQLRSSYDSGVVLVRPPNDQYLLRWLHEITIATLPGLPAEINAGLVFAGSDPQPPPGLDVRGKILVRLGAPVGTAAANRPAPPLPAGVVGTLSIDNLSGPERRRWPVAYSVSIALASSVPNPNPRPAFFLNPAVAEELFRSSGHTYAELRQLYDDERPLPWLELPAAFRAVLSFDQSNISSENVLAVLPGSDPVLSNEYVVVSAHLDGYGVGEPIGGDRVYNGAFDDAAYVATLIDLAQTLHESGVRLRRSLLFAVVTGEEKGLLGSAYYVAHPTVPKDRIVANINLDQLRPLFPLKILTMVGLNESTLGDIARRVAEPMGIRIQSDPEPDRNLIRRSDHYNFMQIGVPAAGFVFGYENGSPEERIYRRWYADRYHSPSDDLQQPWDPDAADKFNQFFGRLVAAVSNADERPQWKPGSVFRAR
jgi:hypothetical protein